jgi:hypothetical protein
MIDDLVRILFYFSLCSCVGSVCLSKGDGLSFTIGVTFLCIGIFVSSFSRHRSTVNERKMLMGYTSDQTDEPSVQLVLIIDRIVVVFLSSSVTFDSYQVHRRPRPQRSLLLVKDLHQV